MSPSFQNPPGRLSPEHEAEIAARAEAATPGPWETRPEYGPHFYAYLGGSHLRGVGTLNFGEGEDAEADKALTVNAREDIRALLAELAAVRAERDQARARVAELERPAEYERPVDEAPIPYVLTEQAEPVVSGCPRNVIGGDAGDHFFKKGALPDSPIACVYCGAKKPEGAAR